MPAAFDAHAEYSRVIARDVGPGVPSADVSLIAQCVTKFVTRMVEVVRTGNGSVTVTVARRKYQKTDCVQTDFLDAAY